MNNRVTSVIVDYNATNQLRAYVVIEDSDGIQGLLETIADKSAYSDLESHETVYAWPEMAISVYE